MSPSLRCIRCLALGRPGTSCQEEDRAWDPLRKDVSNSTYAVLSQRTRLKPAKDVPVVVTVYWYYFGTFICPGLHPVNGGQTGDASLQR